MTESELLKDGERLDDLQRDGYRIIQNPREFCFGMDAVLLSGFARASEGDALLDLGCGSGIIPILMASKSRAFRIVGLEIQSALVDMARRSVLYNRLEDRVEIVEGDIREEDRLFSPSTFDVVTSNPPYMPLGSGIQNPDSSKAIARHELLVTLYDVTRAASRLLRQGGLFFIVHRPKRLADVFVCMRQFGIEPKRLRLVHPYIDKKPSLVLIEGKKGAGAELVVESPLIVFSSDGKYTPELCEIYGKYR